VALSVLLLCACSGSPVVRDSSEQQATRGGVLRFVQEAPRSLDPLGADSVYESFPVNQIFDTLVSLDASLNLMPALAESWTISNDSKGYTFILRDGVQFHDGEPLTAEDVEFTILRHLHPDNGGRSLAFTYLLAIEGAREAGCPGAAADR
jgi:peptide/nickel transport system substrate-binding protein